MSAEPVPRPITVDEFFTRIEDGQKADLIEGTIHMASPDTPHNDKLAFLVRTLIQEYADARGGLGEAFGSRVAFVMGRYRCPEPDVSFVCAERLSMMAATRGTAAPDIAVEVVSTDSVQRDYVQKRVLYEEAGVQEYWIIDPPQGRCEFLRLEQGGFVNAPVRDGRFFQSEVLQGFWLDVSWLLADPLPRPMACLQQILAGGPSA
jgi:Uma2 family endonuclease